MDGADPNYIWNRYPWDVDEPRSPMPDESISAIRSWVNQGGAYVGIDAGGGLLAAGDFIGLVDARRASWNLGTGLVELRIDRPDDPLFDGIRGYWAEDGSWKERALLAMYASNPGVGEDGGCVFAVGLGATALATYEEALPVDGVRHLRPSKEFQKGGSNAAIVASTPGAGSATIFGIEPTYRCQYLSTARLVSNAILKGALQSGA
jgi:glutamine amidotransferase-like uncharacterized protein